MKTPASEQTVDYAPKNATVLELSVRLANYPVEPLNSADALLTAGLAVEHYTRGQSRLQNIHAIREAVIEATGFPSRAARLAVVKECVMALEKGRTDDGSVTSRARRAGNATVIISDVGA